MIYPEEVNAGTESRLVLPETGAIGSDCLVDTGFLLE